MSPEIERLLSRLRSEMAAGSSHKLVSASEQDSYRALAKESFAAPAPSEAAAKAAFLKSFAERIPVEVKADELIIGSQRFVASTGRGNLGHIVVDYGRFLENGVAGMASLVARMPEGPNKAPFGKALEAFSSFILRHAAASREAGRKDLAELCERISSEAPRSFHEALQLLWFVQIFLHAEGASSAISFGRFDQYMLKFFKSGPPDGDAARSLLSAFFIKACEGGESQNLTLGGVGEDGANAENGLSILCLEVMAELGLWQPSISVRLHEGSSPRFRSAAAALAMKGLGQPSFFNDAAVSASLEAVGVPAARARDYGIVGCYEATPQGDACPLTVAGTFNLPAVLVEFLRSGAEGSASFEELLARFKLHLKRAYEEERLPEFRKRLEALRTGASSPFESVCVKGCLESGLCAEEGGAASSLFGVNIMGLGTLVDSLLAMKLLVFEQGRLSLGRLLAELRDDFPDEEVHSLCCGLHEKFGRDGALSNSLAGDLSEFIAELALSSRLGVFRPYPGFFWFGGDISVKVPATPDGRRDGERVSYGCGPGEIPGLEATAILNSASHLANSKCACGNPLKLSFRRGDLSEPSLLALLDGFFKQGGFHLQVNIVDAEELKAAQARPAGYQGLTVRISGFSAVFVKLGKDWQDAIIARSGKSL